MKTIKSRLFAIYGAFALLSVIGIAVVLVLFGRHLSNTALEQALDSATKRFETRLKASMQLGDAVIATIGSQPRITSLFAAGDREGLLKETAPIFDKLKKDAGVKQFQFHLPPATSFLRVHKPEKFGDDLSPIRHTIVAANNTQKPVTGLEKGRYGYGIRAVVPVFYEGKHIGAVEIGSDLEASVKEFTQSSGIRVALFQMAKNEKVTTFDIEKANFSSFDVEIDQKKVGALNVGDKGLQLIDSDLVGSDFAVQLFTIKDFEGKPAMIGMVGVDKSAYNSIGTLIAWVAAFIAASALAGNLMIFFWLDRSIFIRFAKLTKQMGALAAGDTSIQPESSSGSDEIAQMSAAIRVMRDGAIERNQLEQHAREESERERNRQQSIERMINDFREEVAGGLDAMTGNARQLDATAKDLSGVAAGSRQRSSEASLAAGEASQNVQSVAAATEELSASIEEIARQINHTDEMVAKTSRMAQDADGKIAALADNAAKIDEVLTLIKDIAEQTNLLALNATIEAARAGDAGRGFAVVASEVKALANQTAKATEEISARIASIQGDTGTSVAAIRAITSNMVNLAQNTAAISAAAQEQGATTADISSNIVTAADRTQSLASSVAHMDGAIAGTTNSASKVLDAAKSVDVEIGKLRGIVDRFLSSVKAA